MECIDVSVTESASLYYDRGFKLTRLGRDRQGKFKNPNRPGWNTSPNEPAEFTDSDGIGILLGGIAKIDDGYLVCVDLDSETTQSHADEFLPATTMREGKPGEPSALHRYYVVTGVPTDCGPVRSCQPCAARWPRRQALWKSRIQGERNASRRAAVKWSPVDRVRRAGESQLHRATHRLPATCGVARWMDSQRQRIASAKLREPLLAAEDDTTVTTDPLAKVPMEERIRRATPFVDGCEPAISGQGGHDRTYSVARAIHEGFGVSDDDAAMALMHRYNTRCVPLWDGLDLKCKLDEVRKNHQVTGKLFFDFGVTWNDPDRIVPIHSRQDTRLLCDEFYEYCVTHYKRASDLEHEVRAFLQNEADAAHRKALRRPPSRYVKPRVKPADVSNAMDAIKSMTLLPATVSRIVAASQWRMDCSTLSRANYFRTTRRTSI